MANICVAYFCWLVGGVFGLHHFYLGRDKHAFLWWCLPGGYFGLGWLRDFWRLPEYVADANDDEAYRKQIKLKMMTADVPPWKMARWGGMMVVGNMFGMLPLMAVPNKEDIGIDLKMLGIFLNPLGCAVGIWLVGNIGRWEGSLKRPLLACYLTLPLHFFGLNSGSLTTLAGTFFFRRQWRKNKPGKVAFWKRIFVLALCGALYSTLWISFLYFNSEVVHNGDKIKLRDAVGNFIKSPAVQEFGRNLGKLWDHMLTHGFMSTWSQLVESLDPFGEKNALKVLGLENGASQEEIKSRYRELTKTWHPDKVKENKEEAQAKFVEIQQAYERLSNIKNRRAKANKKSDRPESSSDHQKVEL